MRPRRKAAEGLTEYLFLVMLVAITLIAAATLFGWRTQERYLDAELDVLTMDDEGSSVRSVLQPCA